MQLIPKTKATFGLRNATPLLIMVGVLGPGLLEGQGLVMAAIQFLFLSADQDCSTNDVTFATELLNLITLSVDDPQELTEKTPGGKEPCMTTGKKGHQLHLIMK
jgi:hypothetical protein